MAKQELIVGFSYKDMDKEAVGKLQHCAKVLQGLKNALAGDVLKIGEIIAIAHEQFANQGTGNFLKWVEFEAGFSKSSAYNYMLAYKVFANVPNVGRIEDSALYVLAQNDTPEKARKEVLKLTDSGVKVTHKQAKAIIKKYAKPKVKTGGSTPSPAPAQPPEPELTNEEKLKLELKKVRSYIEGLVRALDDANRIKRNTVIHPQSLKLCGQILEGLERW